MNTTSIASLCVALATAVAAAFSTKVESFFGMHPHVTAVIVGVWGVIAHYLPAPTISTPSK